MPKPITVNGNSYSSIAEACRAFQTSESFAHKKLSKGWTPEQVFGLSPQPVSKYRGGPRQITIGALTFATLTAASHHFGISPDLLWSRLKIGWHPEEAVGIRPRKLNGCGGQVYVVTQKSTGKVYVGVTSHRDAYEKRWLAGHVCHAKSGAKLNPASLHKAIRDSGIDDFTFEVVETVTCRMALAAKEVEWIETLGSICPGGFNFVKGGLGDRYGRSKRMTVAGVTYRSFKAAAEAHGLDYHKVKARLDLGWSHTEAFELDGGQRSKKRKCPVMVFGKWYKSVDDAVRDLKPEISAGAVKARISSGMSPDDAFSIPSSEANPHHTPVTVFGVRYPSLREAYRALKPCPGEECIRQRIKKGMQPDDAFTVPLIERKDRRRVFCNSPRGTSVQGGA